MSDVAPNLGTLPASVADMLTCNDNGTITTWIDKTYGRSIVDRPWFLPAGGRAIKGAPENTRNVMAAQRKYMKSILSTGINLDLRGTPIGYVDDSSKPGRLSAWRQAVSIGSIPSDGTVPDECQCHRHA